MAADDLRKLWKLHLVDHAIAEVRAKAAALDPGKKIKAQIDALQAEMDSKGGEAKKLSGELTDLELQQKNIDAKLKKIDADLYGGKVVNPREVENLQKEIVNLKRQRGDHDVRILELWELVPPAKSQADEVEKALDAKKQELADYQKRVVQAKNALEAEFKRLAAQRPEAAKGIPPALLSRYDAIRQKSGGVAMAQIDLKRRACGVCGMNLPEKSIEMAKEGRPVTCEACHRLLYYTEGLV